MISVTNRENAPIPKSADKTRLIFRLSNISGFGTVKWLWLIDLSRLLWLRLWFWRRTRGLFLRHILLFTLVFERASLIRRDILYAGVLAFMQYANVRDNSPPILHGDFIGISHHGIESVGDRVENLAVCHLAILILVIVRNPEQSIFGRDPIALAGRAVTNCAVDREFFLTSPE